MFPDLDFDAASVEEYKTLAGWSAFYGLGVLLFGAGTVGATATAVVLTVAATAASFAYQRSVQKKAQAAARAQAERLRKEQARALAEQQRSLRELSKLEGGFGSPQFAQNLTLMIKRSVVSRRFIYGRARVGGIWLYVETTGVSNDFVHLVLGLAEGPIQQIEGIYFDDELVTLNAAGQGTGKWTSHLTIKQHLGTMSQVADPDLVAASAGKWTSAHKLTGIAYLYIKFTRNLDIYPGLPEVSAVIKGKADILDPRTGVVGYTDNCALCLADYLKTPMRGPGIPWEEIDEESLIHAADVCDQPVALLAGGTEPRYRISGSIDLSSNVEDNIASFIQAMAGDVIFINGRYEIQAGEYRTPTFEITADMLLENISISHVQPRKDRPNVVKGTFVAEANRWQRFDFPSVSRDVYVEEDGQEVVHDLSLELVASGSQAQRLASIELEHARRAKTATLTTGLRGMPAKAGGSVLLDVPRYFDHQPMRVAESTFMVTNDGALLLKFAMIETDPAIYAWARTREKQINVPPEINAKGPRVSTPAFLPEAGEYDPVVFPLAVTITTLTPGATIRYSLVSMPTTSAEGTLYSTPVAVASGETLYARAFKTAYEASSPAIGAFTEA